jgi:ubiquitin-conjugating enzyme E2 J2
MHDLPNMGEGDRGSETTPASEADKVASPLLASAVSSSASSSSVAQASWTRHVWDKWRWGLVILAALVVSRLSRLS